MAQAQAANAGPLDGISGAFNPSQDNLAVVLIVFIALSFYNVFELVLLIFTTFRRWRGLYFWSLLLSAAVGVTFYSLGFLLKFFTTVSPILSVAILSIGWWTMVTGQSFVLYSRLHLVLRDPAVLRRILYMIITDFFILQIPTTVLTFGSNVPNASPTFVTAYNIMEKIQMTGFTIQECIISGFYVWETTKILSSAGYQQKRDTRRIMWQLIGINIAIVIMDLALLGIEYANEYAIQISLKGTVYSLKLKLEFAVLGKLVDFIRTNHSVNASNSLRLNSMRHAGNPATGAPSGRADDPHFYGHTVTDASRPECTSSEEQLNLPDGIILAKTEFSTRVDDRPPPPEYDIPHI